MTSSTTGNKRVAFSRVLLISVALQAAGLLAFYFAEPLRKSVLTAEERDARAMDRAAEARRREVENQKKAERSQTSLKKEDAVAMARKVEKEKATEITRKIAEMEKIRDELQTDTSTLLKALEERSVEDVSLYFYELIHPLGTQLVANAINQREQAPLPAGPPVVAASEALLAAIEQDREKLLDPESFARLRQAHRKVQDTQWNYIGQLDERQKAYPSDLDRLRREDRIEYLVNLMRDQIAELLTEASKLDVKTMNDLPADFSLPDAAPEGRADALADIPVADLHQEANAIFDDIRQLFTAARAANMALEQHTGVADAFKKVNVPDTQSGFAPGAKADAPQTVGELKTFVENMGQASRDVGKLWQQAANMGAAGRAMAGREGAPSPGQPGQQGPSGGTGARGLGAARAAEGRAGRYADMTPFMYASGSGEKGFASGLGGGSDITAKSIRSGYAETGHGTPGAKGPPVLAEEKVIKEALPGRTFSRNSKRTGWLYVDTWYIIGPWENHGRIGGADALPPETLVDLDATYVGKGGRKLSWQFHQSDSIRVKPPDETESSTYYGYTEVFFEEEMQMLVAVASDDAARVWLNGQLIWQDDGLSPWRLDEGFRKVVFRKGFNTLLVRIENGPITCTYSILLCPPDVLP